MVLEDIFRTKRGIYQRDSETGLFTLKDADSTPKRFLGSVDPRIVIPVFFKQTPMVLEDIIPGVRPECYFSELLNRNGEAPGFVPDFVEGYRPFGITGDWNDVVVVGPNRIMFSPEFSQRLKRHDRGIKYELGSKIDQVYNPLIEREYSVQR